MLITFSCWIIFKVLPLQECTRQQGRGWYHWRLLSLELDSHFVFSSSPSSGYWPHFSNCETPSLVLMLPILNQWQVFLTGSQKVILQMLQHLDQSGQDIWFSGDRLTVADTIYLAQKKQCVHGSCVMQLYVFQSHPMLHCNHRTTALSRICSKILPAVVVHPYFS